MYFVYALFGRCPAWNCNGEGLWQKAARILPAIYSFYNNLLGSNDFRVRFDFDEGNRMDSVIFDKWILTE